jgi:hypothetical protein
VVPRAMASSLSEEKLLFYPKDVEGILFLETFASVIILHQCFPNKITSDPHTLAHVNIEFLDDRYPKKKLYLRTVFT